MSEVSLVRVYMIRITYILMVIPGTIIVARILLRRSPIDRGVFSSMLIALFFLSFLVIRYPLKMLPILILECFWKLVWCVTFGLPQSMRGPVTTDLKNDLLSVGGGSILFAVIIPWTYVWRCYFRNAEMTGSNNDQ